MGKKPPIRTYRQESREDFAAGTASPLGHVSAPSLEQLKVGSLQRIADALETQNELTRIAGPGFKPAQYADGLNHLAMQYASDTRTAYIQVLRTSPEMVQKLTQQFGEVLQEMVRVANEEGGQAND